MGQGAREERHLGSFSTAESLFDKKNVNLLNTYAAGVIIPLLIWVSGCLGPGGVKRNTEAPHLPGTSHAWHAGLEQSGAAAPRFPASQGNAVQWSCWHCLLCWHLVLGDMAGSMDFLFHAEGPYIAVKKQIRRKTSKKKKNL